MGAQVGVALSATPEENRGNLCLWPRSHHAIHPLMRSPDGAVLRANGGYTDADGAPLPPRPCSGAACASFKSASRSRAPASTGTRNICVEHAVLRSDSVGFSIVFVTVLPGDQSVGASSGEYKRHFGVR